MSQPTRDEDRQIISRIAAGDRQALAELYTRYRQVMFAFLLHLTTDRGLAEEILQDTLVAVWQCARSFEGRSSLQTWLLGIARRQAHNALRRQEPPLADVTELENLPTREGLPEDAALALADRDALAAAIRQLTPMHREILALIFGQGLAYPEAATILAIPVGTVKSRLNHARRALRALLESPEEVR